MRFKTYILSAFLLGLGLSTFAQEKAKKPKTDKVSTKSYGVLTATNTSLIGGAAYRITKSSSNKLFGKATNHYLNVELVNFRHPKEVAKNTIANNRLTYGKVNYFFVLRPEYGKELLLFKRNDGEGVGLNGIIAFGPSIGIQKPYYIRWDDNVKGSDILSVPFNIVQYSDENRILGADNIYKGILESKINMGVHIKTALAFDISTFRENASGIELGLITEVFGKRPEIMVYSKSPSFFLSSYLTLYFGSKKTK